MRTCSLCDKRIKRSKTGLCLMHYRAHISANAKYAGDTRDADALAAPRPRVSDLVARAAREMLVDISEITGQRRTKMLAAIRSAITITARRQGRSYPEIGAQIGKRDHSTIVHAAARADAYRSAFSWYDPLCAKLAEVKPFSYDPPPPPPAKVEQATKRVRPISARDLTKRASVQRLRDDQVGELHRRNMIRGSAMLAQAIRFSL